MGHIIPLPRRLLYLRAVVFVIFSINSPGEGLVRSKETIDDKGIRVAFYPRK